MAFPRSVDDLESSGAWKEAASKGKDFSSKIQGVIKSELDRKYTLKAAFLIALMLFILLKVVKWLAVHKARKAK